ncbi:MAG: TOBE domain-containing protein, partial [Mesorhizobium sp.]
IGTPEEVYERPATAFVADFLGKANMLTGTVSRSDGPTAVTLAGGQTVNVLAPRPLAPGSAITVVVRPQKLSVGGASANRLPGRVVSASYLGGSADIGGKANIRANAPIAGRVLREGEAIALGFEPDDCVLLDEAGRRIS